MRTHLFGTRLPAKTVHIDNSIHINTRIYGSGYGGLNFGALGSYSLARPSILPSWGKRFWRGFANGLGSFCGGIVGGLAGGLLYSGLAKVLNLGGGCSVGGYNPWWGRGGDRINTPKNTDKHPKTTLKNGDIEEYNKLKERYEALKANPDRATAKKLYDDVQKLNNKPIDDVDKDKDITRYKEIKNMLDKLADNNNWGDLSKDGTSTPGTSTPGTSTPGTSTPGTSTPGTSTPGTSTPGTSTPGTSTPGTSTPGTSTPGTSTPVTTGTGNDEKLSDDWTNSAFNGISEADEKKLAEAGVEPKSVNGQWCLSLPCKLSSKYLKLLANTNVNVAVETNKNADDKFVAGTISDVVADGYGEEALAQSFKVNCKNFPNAKFGISYIVTRKEEIPNEYVITVDTNGKEKNEFIKEYNNKNPEHRIKDFEERTVTFNKVYLVNAGKCIIWENTPG